MELYIIEAYLKEAEISAYVRAVFIGSDGISCTLSLEEENAGIYEKDKATFYCDELNKNQTKINFKLKKVIENGNNKSQYIK